MRALIFAGRHTGELLEDRTEGSAGRKTRFEADGYDLHLHYRMRGMLRILAVMLAQCRKSVPWRDAPPHYPDPFLKHPPSDHVHFSSFPPARFNRRAPYTAPAASSREIPPSTGTVCPSPSSISACENAFRDISSVSMVIIFFILYFFSAQKNKLKDLAGKGLRATTRPPFPAMNLPNPPSGEGFP